MSDDWQPLAPSARWLFHLQALVRLVLFQIPVSIALGLVLGLWVTWQGGLVLGLSLGFIQTVSALWMPSLRFDRWRFRLRDDDLLIQRGVFFKQLTSIPYSRVQHVDTNQGVLEQSFGLANVNVFTASGVGADGFVPGLTMEHAEALRDALVERGGGDDGL